MNDNKFGNLLRRNIIYAYSAQAIVLIISFVFTLILPKILGVAGFGYWQLFIMYTGYLGFFYLGLNDGYYLKNGGKAYKDLDYSKLKSQVVFSFLIHFALAISIIVVLSAINIDPNKKFILILVALYLPFFNMKGFLDQSFQAVNRVKIHSISTILERVLMLVGIILLSSFSIDNYKIYIVIYVLTALIALLYIIFSGKEIVKAPFLSLNETKKEGVDNIKLGFPLMMSAIIGMFIMGTSRQIIEIRWGIEVFSVISLSISLMSFFLVFVTKSGLVLFPSLRTLSSEKQKKWYFNIREIINIVIPLALLSYLPLAILINYWLPNYYETIYYLGILLPLIIFETKTTVLGTTFMKVFKMQKKLLLVNIGVLVTNIIVSSIFAFYFNNLNLVILSILISICLRSLIMEIIISKKFKFPLTYKTLIIILISIIFIITNYFFDIYINFLITFAITSIYLLTNYNNFKGLFKEIKDINKEEIKI